MDTRSTQLKVSPTGRLSRMRAARSRMIGSMVARLLGETMGLTVLRWASCLGGSMAMKLGRRRSGRTSRMVMPPRADSEENTP